MAGRARTRQVWPDDIGKICDHLKCSRVQLAELLKVSKACVSRWEKGTRRPRGRDAELLRELLGNAAAPILDITALRRRLRFTQRDFGQQCGVSRQQVAKWEQGTAEPRAKHFDLMVRLATTVANMDAPTPVWKTDLLTVTESAAYLHVAEKTIRNAIKDGRLPYVRDTIPGPWPKDGRYQMARTDLDAFKMKGYDPYFKRGRFVHGERESEATRDVVAFAGGDVKNPWRHRP